MPGTNPKDMSLQELAKRLEERAHNLALMQHYDDGPTQTFLVVLVTEHKDMPGELASISLIIEAKDGVQAFDKAHKIVEYSRKYEDCTIQDSQAIPMRVVMNTPINSIITD